VTTSWSIPNSPPGGPQASCLWAVLLLAEDRPPIGTDSHGFLWSMIPAMARIDPERERQRLAEFYSGQMDGELEKVAGQADELTDIARDVLRTELARRRLRVELAEPHPVPPASSVSDSEIKFRDLVTVRSYWGLLDAELAKGVLDAAGIECFLFDDNMVRTDWFNANALGGVKLRVDARNLEEANRILDAYVPDDSVSDEQDPTI
jgi:hypothetical protein